MQISNSIKLIAYDCDGVLTDNRVLLDEFGKEYVFFNRGDGYAISQIKSILGVTQVVISTETNPIVKKRCEKLKIDVMFGIKDKASAIKEYCSKIGVDLEQVMFIGNDLNDLSAMAIVGVRGCPADAEREILEISDWVATSRGGWGVVRELYRFLCKDCEMVE